MISPHEVHVAARRGYDAVAPSYARQYDAEHHPLMGWYRRDNLAVLARAFPAGSQLLEIGGGSGEEACWLAAHGHSVTATDVSPAMLRVLLGRARCEGVSHRIHAVATAASDLHVFGNTRFDGAYASFGALNTEPRLEGVAASLHHLLKPGAPFVVSVINRWCLWEIAWGLLHGQPRFAARRLRSGWTSARVGTGTSEGAAPEVHSRYYTAASLAHAFTGRFALRSVEGIGVALPPTYLEPVLARRPWLARLLEQAERAVAARSSWCHLGDHVRLVLVRNADG